ncbi:MAG: hypothetical protein Ct9H90mP23_2670 [Methanobacteriota archaeon]|nr:MAG: hypothetical protein Ct9H90mP23_2670 [Euryarchaeota archaeon]
MRSFRPTTIPAIRSEWPPRFLGPRMNNQIEAVIDWITGPWCCECVVYYAYQIMLLCQGSHRF